MSKNQKRDTLKNMVNNIIFDSTYVNSSMLPVIEFVLKNACKSGSFW